LAWQQISNNLQTPAINCKKRWKSLRDTFIKYHRIQIQNDSPGPKRKMKSWGHYNSLYFLTPHIEFYRLNEDNKSSCDSQMVDYQQIYLKEEYTSEQKQFFFTESTGVEDEEITYQIKLTDDDENEFSNEKFQQTDTDTFIDHEKSFVEERLDFEEDADDELLDRKEITKNEENDSSFIHLEHENRSELVDIVDNHDKSVSDKEVQSRSDSASTTATALSLICNEKNVIDPDERYLLSCLPAFKRMNNVQKAYVRLGIEKLFYDIEIENSNELSSTTKSKRMRTSS
jgi:hypothetical protein